MTEIEAITYFCIIDDILIDLNIPGSPYEKVSNSEIITMAVIAHISFSGNYQKTLETIRDGFSHLFPFVPSLSRFSRRLHSLSSHIQLVLQKLSDILPFSNLFIIDSKPIKVCENIRIPRAKVLTGEEYRGYIPSKREYFYGYRIHSVIDENGFFREVHILEGRKHDLEGLSVMSFNYARGREIIGDKGYTKHEWEDELNEEGIKLNPVRKENDSRNEGEYVENWKKQFRRKIETVFSVVNRFMGVRPYAPTKEGIILKILMSILAYNLYRGFKFNFFF